MKIIPETITVIPEPGEREVNVIMAGMRFTFTSDEAMRLADGLARAIGSFGTAAAPVKLSPPATTKPLEPAREPAREMATFTTEPEPPLKDAIEEIEKGLTGIFKRKSVG